MLVSYKLFRYCYKFICIEMKMIFFIVFGYFKKVMINVFSWDKMWMYGNVRFL